MAEGQVQRRRRPQSQHILPAHHQYATGASRGMIARLDDTRPWVVKALSMPRPAAHATGASRPRSAPPGIGSICIDGTRIRARYTQYQPDRSHTSLQRTPCEPEIEFRIRATGSNNIVASLVYVSLSELHELREELHNAGVAAASETAFYPQPCSNIADESARYGVVLDAWLKAQLSCDDPRAVPALAAFLPVHAYMGLVLTSPSPNTVPAWVEQAAWVRRGVRAKPSKLQAAQRRLALALAELGPADLEDDSRRIAISAAVDLLCGDLQEQVGVRIQGIDYPRRQPTPDALVLAVTARVLPGLSEHTALRVRQLQTAEIARMIEAGVDVNAKTTYKETPLKAAAACGNTAAVQLLLDARADVDDDAGTLSGHTPLDLATKHGHADTVALLLSRRA